MEILPPTEELVKWLTLAAPLEILAGGGGGGRGLVTRASRGSAALLIRLESPTEVQGGKAEEESSL